MTQTHKYITLVLIVIVVLDSRAAEPEKTPHDASVDKVVEAEALEHDGRRSPLTTSEIAKEFGAAAIPEWEKYLDHEDWQARAGARFGLAEIGLRTEDAELRQALFTQIVRSSLNDSRLDGKIAHLFGFKREDATDEVRRLLLERLNAPGDKGVGLRYEPAVIQAIGRLEVREAVPSLKKLRNLEPVDGNEANPFRGRDAMLALARMGDSKAIQDAIATLEAIENGKERTLKLRYLARIRQPEAVEHLKKYLFSDVVYPTEAADVAPIREQDYAYWALTAMLVVPKNVTYTNFREWMAEQKTYTFR